MSKTRKWNWNLNKIFGLQSTAPRSNSGTPPALISDKKDSESQLQREKESPNLRRDEENSYTKENTVRNKFASVELR